MSPNKRIFWNVVATYGRSLFALICGIFSARWVLMSLGAVDYGLFGVVGGLVVFISFLNNTLSTANSRFYSVAIGRARSVEDKGAALDDCRKWFNTALTIHTIVPIVVTLIGYPIGVWAVKNFLTIPPNRIEACIWVFRLTCLSCFVNMASVPFGAMYRAKQLIAELTIYGYATAVINVCCLYYMVSHPSDWLVRYAILTMLLAVVPHILITARALGAFPECKLVPSYFFNRGHIRQVLAFAGWELLGSLCQLLRVQGVSIAVNKYFGASVNAAMSLGNSVDANASSLSSSLIGAFQPAIANAYGEGNLDKMRAFAFRACKFGTLLQLVFVIPLMAELHQILVLWLKKPPQYTAFLCIVALISHLFMSLTQGFYSATNACGKIREYQLGMSVISILTLPIVVLVLTLGGGVYSLGVTMLLAMVCLAMRRVYFGSRLAGMSPKYWACKIFIPLLVVGIISSGAAFLPHCFMNMNLIRIIVSALFAEVAIIVVSWFVVFEPEERAFVTDKLVSRFPLLSMYINKAR